MLSMPTKTNNILAKISVAAKTALAGSEHVELSRYIGAGPSIRSRIRLALAVAFLVVIPTLFLGVLKTEKVFEHTASLLRHDDYLKHILEAKLALKELDLVLWSSFSEQEFESEQHALLASEQLIHKIAKLVRDRPLRIDLGPPAFLEGLGQRLDSLISRAIAHKSSLAPARLTIIALGKELNLVEQRVRDVAQGQRKVALGSLSRVGRDQLILFLLLMFTIPIFIIFVPGWVVIPLTRLRQIASKIELGQLKEVAVRGKDEVAILARSLKTYFLHQEELEQKKSSKIFEMRNILRSVLGRVEEPVFIIDENFNINYTNESAAILIGLPSHQIEGKTMSDCMFCPAVKKALEKAFAGDVADDPLLIKIELSDGRIFEREARLGVVRNRDGEVSRAVLVLHEQEALSDEVGFEENLAYPR